MKSVLKIPSYLKCVKQTLWYNWNHFDQKQLMAQFSAPPCNWSVCSLAVCYLTTQLNNHWKWLRRHRMQWRSDIAHHSILIYIFIILSQWSSFYGPTESLQTKFCTLCSIWVGNGKYITGFRKFSYMYFTLLSWREWLTGLSYWWHRGLQSTWPNLIPLNV